MASNATLDFRFVCRTCLVSDADFYKLDAPIITDDADQAERVSLMECLRYCTRLGQAPELPVYICTECSAALQVAYNFIQNAINADQVLRQKLCVSSLHSIAGAEDSWALNSDAKAASREMPQDASGGGDEGRVMKFRCKICKEKLESKRSLKEHVRLHLDIISYKCEMCQFESKKRSQLSQHYLEAHGIEAPREHLKPSTALAAVKKATPAAKDFKPTSEYFTPVAPPVNALPPMPTTTARTDIDVEEELMKLTSNSEQVRVVGGSNVAIVNGSVITTETNATHQQMPLDALTAVGNGLMEAGLMGAEADGLCDYADMGVGNQLIVMSDGTVQEVIGNKGVVIEYINAGGDPSLGNLQIVQIDGNAVNLNEATALALEGVIGDSMPLATASNTIINMDVDDMIIEEAEPEQAQDTQEEIFVDVEGSNMEVEIPHSVIEMPKVKLIKCKICTENFNSQDKLKTHMLSHNEIPHFFCDQCNFYTFYKIDLTHHYTSQHNIQPTIKQLQPKNKVIENNVKQVYTCDLCLFETHVKANLRRHYLSKHQVEANEVQLRPTTVEDSMDPVDPVPPVPAKKPKKTPKVDYPTGYSCKKCHKVFYNRDTLQDHFKDDCVVVNNSAATATTNSYMHIMEPSGMVEQTVLGGGETQHVPAEIMDDGQAQLAAQYVMQSMCQPALEETIVTSATMDPTTAGSNVNKDGGGGSINASQLIDFPDDLMPILEETVQTLATPQPTESATANAVSAAQVPETVASTSAIPLDAIPQIVETDNTFDNEIEFDFNGDTFDDEDFDDENDADEFKDLLLTSDEEMEDAINGPPEGGQEADGGGGDDLQRPVCVQCNKKFYSQYLFENHMFMHRGLAPYRCEMCTNLYNTKRALIRHYRGVHKTIPTRDMVQAKGDKLPTENATVPEANGPSTLMCSKCPFEANDMSNVQIHLSTEHGTNDEKFIIRKLAYECPRCIRSFARKAQLARHLERNHSTVNSIQRPQATTDAELQEAPAEGKAISQNNNNNNSISQDAFALVNNNNNHIDHHKTGGNPAAENNNRRYNTRKNHAHDTGTAIATDEAMTQKAPATTITTTTANTRKTHDAITSTASTSSSAATATAAATSTASVEATASGAPISAANNSDCGRVAAATTTTTNTTTTHASPSSSTFSCLTRSIASPPSPSAPSGAAASAATEAAPTTPTPTTSPLMKPYPFSYDYLGQAFDETLANMGSNGDAQFVPLSPTAVQQQQPQIAYKNVSLGLHKRLEDDTDDEQEESLVRQDNSRDAPFKCNGCDFVCGTLKELDSHSKSHHVHDTRELFNFECTVCRLRYKTVANLKVHMKRHVDRSHQCPQCPKAFISDTELKTHLLSHCNEHRYRCDMCAKRFGYAHHLRRHQDIVHHGKRQRCPMYGCGRVFTTRSHLKVHMLDHTGQLPYKCKFCSRLFKRRNALRSHTSYNHGVELTDEDIAEIYQKSTGRTNPHDISIVGKRVEAVSTSPAVDPTEALNELAANLNGV